MKDICRNNQIRLWFFVFFSASSVFPKEVFHGILYIELKMHSVLYDKPELPIKNQRDSVIEDGWTKAESSLLHASKITALIVKKSVVEKSLLPFLHLSKQKVAIWQVTVLLAGHSHQTEIFLWPNNECLRKKHDVWLSIRNLLPLTVQFKLTLLLVHSTAWVAHTCWKAYLQCTAQHCWVLALLSSELYQQNDRTSQCHIWASGDGREF